MAGISGQMRTVRQLFKDDYTVGDFQRGYTWQHEHVATLVRDLASAFERRRDSEVSGEYYLGAVVTHNRFGYHHIIDGQQRLTTLLLLLTWLMHALDPIDKRRSQALSQLVLHSANGRDAFPIDVEERQAVMKGLYDDPARAERLALNTDTARNLLDRFATIAETFPDELRVSARLKQFTEWLLDSVIVAKIEAEKEADAYIIFETTNDRGQQLGAAQLLKNFLQAQIDDLDLREHALQRWTGAMRELQRFGPGGDVTFIHHWLQARHADLPTPPNRPGDLNRIEQDLFAWIKANAARMGLGDGPSCYRFMHDEFAVMADAYTRARAAEEFPQRGLDSLFFLSNLRIGWMPLARALVMAGVDPLTPLEDNLAKMRAAATFAEILAVRLAWQPGLSTAYGKNRVVLERAIAAARHRSVDKVVAALTEEIEALPIDFRTNMEIGLPRNAGARARNIVHTLLARMSACLDEAFGDHGAYSRYEVRSPAARGFTIEHVLPNEGSEKGMFESEAGYAKRRNKLGALLLIRRRDNEALDDADFATRRAAYRELTRLSKTFHPDFYTDEATRILGELDLPFTAPDRFGPADIEARHEAYVRLAELTWSPQRIAFAARPAAAEDSRVYALDQTRAPQSA